MYSCVSYGEHETIFFVFLVPTHLDLLIVHRLSNSDPQHKTVSARQTFTDLLEFLGAHVLTGHFISERGSFVWEIFPN